MKSASTALVLAVLSSSLVPARAATRTASFAVTATVQNTCLASANNMMPRSYAGAWTNTASPVSVTCNSPAPYNVSINVKSASGSALPGQIPPTQILPGASPAVLSYALLPGSAPAVKSIQTADANPVPANSSGSPQAFAARGQSGWAQYLVPGSDTLIVTVTY